MFDLIYAAKVIVRILYMVPSYFFEKLKIHLMTSVLTPKFKIKSQNGCHRKNTDEINVF